MFNIPTTRVAGLPVFRCRLLNSRDPKIAPYGRVPLKTFLIVVLGFQVKYSRSQRRAYSIMYRRRRVKLRAEQSPSCSRLHKVYNDNAPRTAHEWRITSARNATPRVQRGRLVDGRRCLDVRLFALGPLSREREWPAELGGRAVISPINNTTTGAWTPQLVLKVRHVFNGRLR